MVRALAWMCAKLKAAEIRYAVSKHKIFFKYETISSKYHDRAFFFHSMQEF